MFTSVLLQKHYNLFPLQENIYLFGDIWVVRLKVICQKCSHSLDRGKRVPVCALCLAVYEIARQTALFHTDALVEKKKRLILCCIHLFNIGPFV